MANCELIRFASADLLANAVAARWLVEIETLTRQQQNCCVALSGGRIARLFFDAVATRASGRTVHWDSVDFFWADERCVPPDHPESNFALAQAHLLAPLLIPASQIHRVRGELAPELAAQDANAELGRLVPRQAGGVPALDLVLLGMGEDGHVASLFPGAPALVVEGPHVYCPVTGPKPPPQRITMTYAALAAAAQVWVLASGPGKELALRESLIPVYSATIVAP